MELKITDIPQECIPNHIAIILDGNGRWAQKRNLPRLMGHRAGMENLFDIGYACIDYGIKNLTVYAFSTENWKRPMYEKLGLKDLFMEAFTRKLREMDERGIRFVHIGERARLPQEVLDKIDEAVSVTAHNTELTFCAGINYGSRNEIMHAVQNIVAEGIPAEEITEQTITDHLFTAGLPDPDLVIRTSGEERLSNFLLWQSAYSEWYFPEALFPDFNRQELLKALQVYSKRNRRFGGLENKKGNADQKES